MKKICFFSGDITRSGGTERVSAMIANRLAKIPDYQVVYLSLVEQKEEPFYELDENIRHFALGKKWLSPGPAYLPLIPKVRRFVKEHGIDVIVDIDIVLDVLSVPACAGLGTKVISWEHSNCEYELSVFYRRMIVRFFTKRADRLVTLTPGDAQQFRKLFGREDRIQGIYTPVEEPRSMERPERENSLVTVARLVPVKGFDLLVQVAKRVLSRHPDWKWYLCGEGPERQMLERFIEENDLQGKLILTGLVTNVEEYLVRSKIFVLTSRSEGLPMSILEARTCGVPCVSFDIRTGPADLIRDGENGYLIAPFDCDKMAERILEMMEDPGKLARMSAAAGEHLERFYMPQVIEEWRNLIDGL
ncbi:MAG: glycosyltransferase family 4 protein [Lachnospiraceae bacterium]|nr:glycosyltransferase family 4 protein [Lachnospiraceae bacterium]